MGWKVYLSPSFDREVAWMEETTAVAVTLNGTALNRIGILSLGFDIPPKLQWF